MQKQYESKSELAINAQRNGNMALYAELATEAQQNSGQNWSF